MACGLISEERAGNDLIQYSVLFFWYFGPLELNGYPGTSGRIASSQAAFKNGFLAKGCVHELCLAAIMAVLSLLPRYQADFIAKAASKCAI